MVSFSVIIPVYNRVNLIDRTLSTILNLDLEIIVVDDGSADGTVERLQKYGARIVVLSQANRGAGAARNLGIDRAMGDYTLFLDSDDLWFPWSLDTFKQVILQHDYPAFVAGKAIEFTDKSELKSIAAKPIEAELFPDYYATTQESLWLLNGAVAIKTKILKQVGGFAPKRINCEDSDLWLKLGIAQGFVLIKSPVVLAYYQHSNSAINDYSKTFAGAWHLIDSERWSLYPGGQERERERWKIMLRHIRPVSLAYLDRGDIIGGWQMYRATFRWNLAIARWVYLAGFWLMFVRALTAKISDRLLKIFSYT